MAVMYGYSYTFSSAFAANALHSVQVDHDVRSIQYFAAATKCMQRKMKVSQIIFCLLCDARLYTVIIDDWNHIHILYAEIHFHLSLLVTKVRPTDHSKLGLGA